MSKLCFFTALFFAFRALAIDVIWDFLPRDVLQPGEYTFDVEIECNLCSQNYFFDDAFDVTQGSNTYTVSAKYLGWFCAANVGDVVSDATFTSSTINRSVSGRISARATKRYFAFEHYTGDFGWIELTFQNGIVQITGSALALNGESIVVGKDYSDSTVPWRAVHDYVLAWDMKLYVDVNHKAGYGVPAEIGEKYGCEAAFKTIQEAFDYLDGKAYSDVDIYIAPGVYPPVTIHEPLPYADPWTIVQLVPYFDVTAIGGPGSVIIDGGGVTNGITYLGEGYQERGYISWTPREWHGIVVSNAVCGAVDGFYSRCVATCCKVGFKDANLVQCAAIRNTGVGLLNCSANLSLVADNVGLSGQDAAYDCTGAQNCNISNSIIWGNTKDGLPANWSGGGGANNCTMPTNGMGGACICADPMFADSEHGDYGLQMGSPCINRLGNITLYEYDEIAWDIPWTTDLAGNPRVQRGSADLGPYEYQPTNEHQTITAPVPVEFAWIDEKCPKVLAKCGGDYDKAVLMKSANPVDIALPEPLRTYYSIWESYVADLDPTNSNQTLRATIEMVEGRPHVTADPESPHRKYTIVGKEKLADEKWQENLPRAQFFKVKVGLK